MSKLPSPETMLAYASILEKPQYSIDPKTGRKFLLPTGEVVEAACAALRHCAQPPVAWLYESWNGGDSWGKHFSFDKPAGNQWQRNIVRLLALPPADHSAFEKKGADLEDFPVDGWSPAPTHTGSLAAPVRETKR